MTALLGIDDVDALADRLLAPRSSDANARAEEHARRVARALVPWGGAETERVAWRTLARERRVTQRALRSGPHVSDALLCAANAAVNLAPREGDPWSAVAERLSQRPGRRAEARVFERDVADAEGWARAVASGARVAPWPMPQILDPATGRYQPLAIPRATYGRAFAELPDPFTPLLAIWELGFVLDRVTETAIELVAPPL